jgi:hypothetical protein
VNPVPDPLLLFGSVGNRTRVSGYVANNSNQSVSDCVRPTYRQSYIHSLAEARIPTHPVIYEAQSVCHQKGIGDNFPRDQADNSPLSNVEF